MSRGREDRPDAVEHHPATFDWRKRLEEFRYLRWGEGEGTYAATGEGAYWIVHDSSTMADIFDGEEDMWSDLLITLERYDDEERWKVRADALAGEQRRRDLREHYRGHPYQDKRFDVIAQFRGGSRQVRLPLGQLWRARENEQLIVLVAGGNDGETFTRYVEILDEFGLFSLGATHGSLRTELLAEEYILVSDPDEIARTVLEDDE